MLTKNDLKQVMQMVAAWTERYFWRRNSHRLVLRDGSTPLTADWDIGSGRKLKLSRIDARDAAGIAFYDDGGNLELFLKDGGQVGLRVIPTLGAIQGLGGATTTNFMALFHQYGVTPEASAVLTTNANQAVSIQAAGAAYLMARDIANDIEIIFGTSSLGAVFLGSMTNHPLQFRIGNTTRWAIDTSGQLGGQGAAAAPQGPFHAHNGTGGFLFVTKTGINGTAQTIIPDGAGDILSAVSGDFLVVDSTGMAVAKTIIIKPGLTATIATEGVDSIVVACNANGSLTVARNYGTRTYKLAAHIQWL